MLPDLEKCPRRLLVCEKSSFLNEASRHEAHVSKHSFNYKVSENTLLLKPLSNTEQFFQFGLHNSWLNVFCMEGTFLV